MTQEDVVNECCSNLRSKIYISLLPTKVQYERLCTIYKFSEIAGKQGTSNSMFLFSSISQQMEEHKTGTKRYHVKVRHPAA